MRNPPEGLLRWRCCAITLDIRDQTVECVLLRNHAQGCSRSCLYCCRQMGFLCFERAGIPKLASEICLNHSYCHFKQMAHDLETQTRGKLTSSCSNAIIQKCKQRHASTEIETWLTPKFTIRQQEIGIVIHLLVYTFGRGPKHILPRHGSQP